MASRMEQRDHARVPGGGVWSVVRRGWLSLIAAVGLSYVLMMVGVLVAANVARALALAEVSLFESPRGVLPVWAGILSYVQGVALVVTAVVLAFSALLAATVEATRSVRNGERVAPWTPFHRGLCRILPVTAGVVVLVPRLVLLSLATGILLVASVITVPVAALTGVAWLARPSWRKQWMRWPLLLAVPFGILFLNMVRWALWLPFVVVDGAGGRSGLRASRDAVRPQWATTARPLAGLGAVICVAVAGLIAMSQNGVGPVVAGLTTVAVGVVALMAFAIVATLLYERHTGSMPPPGPGPAVRFPLLPRWAPSPGLVVILAVCLCAQSLWVTQRVASADPVGPGTTYVVNTLDDDLAPDLSTQCVDSAAPCMLRAAVALANTSGLPTPSIGFAPTVNGDIDLLGALMLCTPVTIDGGGTHIKLRNTDVSPGMGSAIIVGCPTHEGSESPPPGPIVLRNLTIAGMPTGHAAGLYVTGGTVTVENSTFTDHHYNDELGSAIHNAGTLSVLNSTFVENYTNNNGATIWTWGYGPLSVVNSTFVDNHGGGVGAAPTRTSVSGTASSATETAASTAPPASASKRAATSPTTAPATTRRAPSSTPTCSSSAPSATTAAPSPPCRSGRGARPSAPATPPTAPPPTPAASCGPSRRRPATPAPTSPPAAPPPRSPRRRTRRRSVPRSR